MSTQIERTTFIPQIEERYKQVPTRIRRVFSLVLMGCLWEILGEIIAPRIVASFSESVVGVIWLLNNQSLLQEVILSSQRAVIGFTIAVSLGIVLGVAMGLVSAVDDFFQPLVSVIYPTPKITLIPMVILWFGITNNALMFLVILSATFPTIINTYDGVNSVNRNKKWIAKSLGANRMEIIKKVIIPDILPNIFAGMRLSLGLCWIMVFAMEIIFSGLGGVGRTILYGKTILRYDIVFGALLVMAVLGYTSDRLLAYIYRRICYWNFEQGDSK
jgi:ABC-type nitrate/sulfonate/bicarbonate transport system permease component